MVLLELQQVPLNLLLLYLLSRAITPAGVQLSSFFTLSSTGLTFSQLELVYSSFSLSSSSITLLFVMGTDNKRVLPFESPESIETRFPSAKASYFTK